METSELLRKIITLPVVSSGLAEEMLSGNFSSIFKGQGMEFDEARHYEPGDDIRSIDWNASARFGTPFVKMYREERELTILLLIDVSASMHRSNFSRNGISPYEQALICAALLAFSAEHTGQQVGAFFFDREIEKVYPPRKGRKHIMSIVTTALQYQKEGAELGDKRGSNIASALAGAQKLLKKRSLVALISDFYSINWENEMASLCQKHDFIALRICDPEELLYPGLITLEDPETGVKIEAPAGLDSFRSSWELWHRERSTLWASLCRRCDASFLELSTADDAPASLLKFFGSHIRSHRKKRKRL